MIEQPLPDGWRWVQLNDVCHSKTGTINPNRDIPNESFTYIDIGSIDSAKKRIVEPKTLLGKDAPSRARQRVCAGDVIVSTTRPNLNSVALVPPELNNQICSTGFCVLRPISELDSAYLFGYVRTPEFINNLSNLVKGAMYPAVTDSQVMAQSIPLPSLPEQKRIAAIIEEQMADIDAARIAIEAELEAAEALTASHLCQVFERDDVWEQFKLGDVLIRSTEIVHPHDNPKGIATFVGLEHIESGTGKRIGSLEVEMAELTGRKPRFYEGQLVYGYLRPYLNKIWVAEFDGLCSVDQYIYSINSDLAVTDYIFWFMLSPVYMERSPVGSNTSQLPRIRLEEVAAVEFGLPSLEDQQRIVRDIQCAVNEINHACTALRERLQAVNLMPAAVLRRAFNGEL